jgi:hypothetical protein
MWFLCAKGHGYIYEKALPYLACTVDRYVCSLVTIRNKQHSILPFPWWQALAYGTASTALSKHAQ